MTDGPGTAPPLTGATALLRVLRSEGLRHVFGVAGGKLAPLLHGIAGEAGLRYLGLRHEAAGPMMAAAIAAAGGGVAVALAEMGPGALNLLAGTGGAAANHLPLLLVTTNQHRAAAYPHAGLFMDLDTTALFRPLVKWSAVVSDARRMPELVRRALREALSGAPGPVHLDIPHDVLTQPCAIDPRWLDSPAESWRAAEGPRPAASSVAQAAALLASARRPLIVAGGGAVASGAEAALDALAERLGAAVVPTQMAVGTVPTDSPRFIGQGGIIGGEAVLEAFARADLVLAVGCRFSSWLWDERGPLARPPQRIIAVNIDPSALGGLVPHDVAMPADARLALEDLLAALEGRSIATEPGWLEGLRATRLRYEARLLPADDGNPVMHPAALAHAIGAALPADALATYDGGHTSFWSNDLTPALAPRTRLHEPGMCQLGFGLPAALALQLLHPGRMVVNLTGDGAFGFTLQELDTARREGLPVISIVHNNAAWGVIAFGQSRGGKAPFGTGLEGTDYAAIARGFGCHGEVLTRAEEVSPALARARASGLPAVLDCRTRFVPHPCMPAFGRMNRYGFEAFAPPGAEPG
ncbi:thiamine pyrophosphate-binding protein [Roseomonas populi]|uniref:Thiamine pyrophosphate-binding protein n=1 Tax=Roseomonas populi TaxID=3121582 RepID=A0ABT1X5F5_9PROT|nr:thiamine pyrophosphate-binding protein [Roseomonas pecuniae]MCR0983345.1 thiamine pyrophosphate-binding protein [Roseomonas pecuniae]